MSTHNVEHILDILQNILLDIQTKLPTVTDTIKYADPERMSAPV